MQDQMQQLTQMRQHSLEQYAQVNSEIDILQSRKQVLKKRASLLLEDLRQLTAQINELSAKAEKEKAHDIIAQAATDPG